jgi:hypothetical protein
MKTLKYADDNHHNFIFVAKRKIRRMFDLDRLFQWLQTFLSRGTS